MTATMLDWEGTLNKLAGTQNLGAQAAANVWAGTTDAQGNPRLETLAALNVKAGNGSNPSKWVGLGAVCNQLAGTSNQEPLRALQIRAGETTS